MGMAEPRRTLSRLRSAWPHKLWASATLSLWWGIPLFVYTQQQGGGFLHTYQKHWLNRMPSGSDSYPLLARSFAFPLMGITDHSDVGRWFHTLFWFVALWYPVALLVLVWLRATSSSVVATVSLGLSPYTAAVILSGVLLAYGLWLPFSYL